MSMTRTPVPDTSGRPMCFGLSHTPGLRTCRDCLHQHHCRVACMEWSKIPSLMEALNRAEAKLCERPTDIHDIYRLLYQERFGRTPDDLDVFGSEYRSAFRWVETFCRTSKIDPVLFITAQMYGLAKFIDENKHLGRQPDRFLPNMMCGENAKNRYNVHLDISKRVFKQATKGAFDNDAPLHQFVADLVEDEERVLRAFVTALRQGIEITVDAVASELYCDDAWWGLLAASPSIKQRKAVMQASLKFEDRLDTIVLVARLRAAVTVASEFLAPLPYRIGFREPFDRVAFASLLASMYPITAAPARKPIPAKLGEEWL